MDSVKIDKTEWDLNLLGKNEEELENNKKEVEQAVNSFVKKWKDRKDYLTDSKILKEALDDYEKLYRDYGTSGNIGYYWDLRKYQSQDDPQVKAECNKIEEFYKKLDNDIQFFELNVSKIGKDLQNSIIHDSNLVKYKHFLEKLFAKGKYLLSDEQEKIMNLMSSNAYSKWVDMIQEKISKTEKEIIIDGKKELKGFEFLMNTISHEDKRTRDLAAAKVNELLYENAETSEVEINAVLSYRKIADELRGYERPDTNRHIADDMESDVIDVLIKSVTDRFDISKRFYKLKANLLGVNRLDYHERNIKFGKVNQKYDYEESLKLTYKAFSDLNEKFGKLMKEFVEENRIDVYPRKGKSTGGYCIHNLFSQPVYLLLNHTDRLQDVRVIAHELGHGINYELMKEKLSSSLDFGTSLATAEVASTFMEDFTVQEILKKADDELKFSIIMMQLDNFVATILRQTACYNFEWELHSEFRKKGYLSKEEIGKIFQKNMAAYMGEYVEQSPGSENWWIHWSHIRRPFYVYSYASGLLISTAMQNKVKKDPKFIEKVLEFLSAGLSDSPKNLFLKMSIDVTKKEFWDAGLDEIEGKLDEAEKLAKKLGKIK